MRNETDFHPLPQNELDVKSGNESQNAFNNKNVVSNSKLTFRDFCEWNSVDWIFFIDLCTLDPREIVFSGTPHAKKSYIILTCTQTLCKLCGTLLIVGFITTIFKETGSILSDKDSSTLIVVVQFISNAVFLLIVEQINRKVWIEHILSNIPISNNLNSHAHFADTLCLVVSFDGGQLCPIHCLWIFLEQTTWIWMDADNFCCCNGFFQLNRFYAAIVHHDAWALATKSTQKYTLLWNINLTLLSDDFVFRFASPVFRFLPHCFGSKCFWADPFFSPYWMWLVSTSVSSYFQSHAF